MKIYLKADLNKKVKNYVLTNYKIIKSIQKNG